MAFKHVGYKWELYQAERVGKPPRERVHPSLRKPGHRLSPSERAERQAAANRKKKDAEERALQVRLRAVRREQIKLARSEERLAAKQRVREEQAQWEHELEMEDYVLRGVTPGG